LDQNSSNCFHLLTCVFVLCYCIFCKWIVLLKLFPPFDRFVCPLLVYFYITLLRILIPLHSILLDMQMDCTPKVVSTFWHVCLSFVSVFLHHLTLGFDILAYTLLNMQTNCFYLFSFASVFLTNGFYFSSCFYCLAYSFPLLVYFWQMDCTLKVVSTFWHVYLFFVSVFLHHFTVGFDTLAYTLV